MKKIKILFICLFLVLTMVGCGNSSTVEESQTNLTLNTSDMFTSRDKEIGYDESTATKITLNNESITITKEGVYLLTGSIADGQIVVEVGDTEKVQLVLNGVSISSGNSAPIYVKSGDKVFVTLASGSENALSVIGEYAKDDKNNVDSVVFSKSDITFNGTGSLTVTASYGHGIVGKDDVVFVGGTYNITAARHGISANDSVKIADGDFTISAGKDGIQVENTKDSNLGYLYIANGNFKIDAEVDGLSASGSVDIVDGDFDIITGEGSASVTLQSDGMGFGNGMGRPGQLQTTKTEENTISQKGIKSDKTITIQGGNFNIDTVDIVIKNGEYSIKTGDDGMHSDSAVIIEDGTFSIPYCYEGIEGLSVTINGGNFDIISSDDGINAAGGTDSSGFGGRGGDPFQVTDGAFVTINGGTITIVSDGDSIDSNGALTINGGKLNLTCNGNGNTAIDASGTYLNNGGDITTNDGSESVNHMIKVG